MSTFYFSCLAEWLSWYQSDTLENNNSEQYNVLEQSTTISQIEQ